MKKWYVAKNSNDTQGLIIDEETGENIAISYYKDNAQLIAAAPELLEALKAFVDMPIVTEKEMYFALTNAKLSIAKAEGK